MNKLFWASLLLLFSFAAKGQGCPNGSVALPTGACGSQADANNMRQDDYDAETAERLRNLNAPRWEDRYGAIANSPTSTAGGVARNMSSALAAKRKALADCSAGDCRIAYQVRNSCLATAWGGGISGFAGDPDIKKAETMALDNCKNGGGTDCKIDYSACSLPVRVR